MLYYGLDCSRFEDPFVVICEFVVICYVILCYVMLSCVILCITDFIYGNKYLLVIIKTTKRIKRKHQPKDTEVPT